MSEERRAFLIVFCVGARAWLEDVPIDDIDKNVYTKLSDDELERESDWLDDLLGK